MVSKVIYLRGRSGSELIRLYADELSSGTQILETQRAKVLIDLRPNEVVVFPTQSEGDDISTITYVDGLNGIYPRWPLYYAKEAGIGQHSIPLKGEDHELISFYPIEISGNYFLMQVEEHRQPFEGVSPIPRPSRFEQL